MTHFSAECSSLNPLSIELLVQAGPVYHKCTVLIIRAENCPDIHSLLQNPPSIDNIQLNLSDQI